MTIRVAACARISRSILFVAAVALAGWTGTARAYRDPPPDASGRGPSATATAEYRFPAELDNDVFPGHITEVWARVYWPDPLPDNSPLLVFLHGNHATCGRCPGGMFVGYECADGSARIDDSAMYTADGTCPSGYVVSPSHEGYGYIADALASWGYLVVSVNVNRGINGASGVLGDTGLNLVRGRMILKHLAQLSRWNQGVEPTADSLGIDLTGKLDFSNIGLMGHSRGGEGMRAAYQQYRDTGSLWPDRIGPATFKAMFEIGPVDGQTSRILTPDGLDWEVILPMCDGDVSNLQGVRPYDRVRYAFDEDPPTPKGTSTVYGAIHNYFNTEWQVPESGAGCTGPSNPPIFQFGTTSSPQQQQVGMSLVMALFRGAIGPSADPTFLNTFDPLYLPPTALSDVTRVDRGFTSSPRSPDVSLVLEDFTDPSTLTASGLDSLTLGSVAEHDGRRRAALLSWISGDPSVFLESDWASGPVDLSGYSIFEFDVERNNSPLNPPDPTNFHVQLVGADGSLSDPVSAADYAVIDGPQGSARVAAHTMLQTARIPIEQLTSIDLTQVAGVRFTFDDTQSGQIFLSTVSADVAPPAGAGAAASAAIAAGSGKSLPRSAPNTYRDGNAISGLRLSQSLGLGNAVVLELTASAPFEVRNELIIVKIGGREFDLVGYRDGDLRRLSAFIPEEELSRLPEGAEVSVQYGRGDNAGDRWVFPPLSKAALGK